MNTNLRKSVETILKSTYVSNWEFQYSYEDSVTFRIDTIITSWTLECLSAAGYRYQITATDTNKLNLWVKD